MEISELLQRLRRGDACAARELVDSYYPEVFRLSVSILEDAAEAEEASQDVFMAVLGALDTYRGEAAFTTWLYAITVNVCRQRRRQGRARERLKRTPRPGFACRMAGAC